MILQCRVCKIDLSVGDPFANGKEFDAEIYNSMYGCDTGCEYVRLQVTCPNCGDFFETGDFGSFEDEDEQREYLEQFYTEYSS